MVHTQPLRANLRCQRWQEGCVGKQKQLVDDRCLLLRRKVEREAWYPKLHSWIRQSGGCVRYTVKTILWKLYCENYTVTVTVTILYYTILYYTGTTCGDSRWVYTSLYYSVLLTVNHYTILCDPATHCGDWKLWCGNVVFTSWVDLATHFRDRRFGVHVSWFCDALRRSEIWCLCVIILPRTAEMGDSIFGLWFCDACGDGRFDDNRDELERSWLLISQMSRMMCEIGNLSATHYGDGRLGNSGEEVRCDWILTSRMSWMTATVSGAQDCLNLTDVS